MARVKVEPTGTARVRVRVRVWVRVSARVGVRVNQGAAEHYSAVICAIPGCCRPCLDLDPNPNPNPNRDSEPGPT